MFTRKRVVVTLIANSCILLQFYHFHSSKTLKQTFNEGIRLPVEQQIARLLSNDIPCEEGDPLWKRRLEVEQKRSLSINLGNGDCQWTEGEDLGIDYKGYGLLLAAYPGSGIRLGWQHVEGLTGVMIGDDFTCKEEELGRTGIIKTQFPHYEGIWSWGNKMDEVILFIRSPKSSIVNYHSILAEISYAHDCETAYAFQDNLFKHTAKVENWEKWRDYLLTDELRLWSWHIDYWMEGGTQYWTEWDFERNGQFPFSWVEKEDRVQDANCAYYDIDCKPKAVIAYELLNDDVTGPDEAKKIAEVLQDKPDIPLIEKEAWTCVWHATMNSKLLPHDGNRGEEDYIYTYSQLVEIKDTVVEMKTKYTSNLWTENKVAKDLVSHFSLYISELTQDILDLEDNKPPTHPPNANYDKVLSDWYTSIGKGDRYNKSKVQHMVGFWKYNSHLYD